MPVSKSIIAALDEYLEDSGPNSSNEWGMKCPLHDDNTRSASLNVKTGAWYCQACDVGGDIKKLVKDLSLNGSSPKEPKEKVPFPHNDAQVKAWQSALRAEAQVRSALQDRRGLSDQTIDDFEVGWDVGHECYVIPIRDASGELVNVRSYQLDPSDDRRKIWSVKGHGSPTLYPVDELIEANEVIICEGEWDTMLTIQKGFHAVTRTGGATSWNPEWNSQFRGLVVYVCQDCDKDGQKGALKIVKNLRDVAAEVHVITLPYEITKNHGQDLTDFWLDGYEASDLRALMDAADDIAVGSGEEDPTEVSVLDTFDSQNVGETLSSRVTVTGKRNPPHLVPRKVELECTMDAGPKCKACSMMMAGGTMRREVLPNDPAVMQMMEASTDQVRAVFRSQHDIVKCNKLLMGVEEHQTVEEVFVRPAMDQDIDTDESGDYTTRRIYAVGQHDTDPNSTVRAVGQIHPNPRSQKSEFQTWKLEQVDTNIEKFEMTPEMHERLKTFQPDRGQTILHKLEHIADDLAHNVTKIYNRLDMHIFMDLVFHSVLAFDLLGERIHKGWLDGMIVGDTRTGKSAAAGTLRKHYGLGEMISCEAASFAGVVGGLTQMSNNAWEVSWGSVPLNDRRIVIMDEVSGLTPEQIAMMSSIRSSGEAELTKIKSEKTHARTRLLWLGNPRNAKMADYTYGVQAIRPLVGNNEDVARFDFAMSVQSTDVDSADINREHEGMDHVYTAGLCHDLLLWVWSRRPEQIVWAPRAEDAIYEQAIILGDKFEEDPPLVQGANIRVKVARIAMAIAARLYSTDESGDVLEVKRSHVIAASDYLEGIYTNAGFGYAEVSREAQMDVFMAEINELEVTSWLEGRPMFSKALRHSARFKRVDLEDMMNVPREQISGDLNFLWERRMLVRDGAFIRCSPTLQEILRSLAP